MPCMQSQVQSNTGLIINNKNHICDQLSILKDLSPYPCFISLLYLDLYVLGDDALIS